MELYWWNCIGGTVSVDLCCWWNCVGELCWLKGAGGTVLAKSVGGRVSGTVLVKQCCWNGVGRMVLVEWCYWIGVCGT